MDGKSLWPHYIHREKTSLNILIYLLSVFLLYIYLLVFPMC